nr:ABC transporter permease [Pseudoclavibacter sp. Marseille-Q3772]
MNYIQDMQQVAADRMTRLAKEDFQSQLKPSNPVSGTLAAVRELVERRELLGLLVRRELVGRYKDSVLGFAWSLIRPLTQLLIYYLVMGQFLGAARSIENFAVYIFTGLTLWGLFSETIMSMTGSIVANGGLIKKVYLPREIFPLASVGSSIFNFCIQMIVLLAAAAIAGTLSFGGNLLYALAAFVLIIIWATALGFILSATNVYFRDVQYLVDVLILLLMWMSPIVYSWSMVSGVIAAGAPSWVTDLYINNPITLAVMGFQNAFWAPGSPGAVFPEHLMTRMVIATIVGVFFLWFGQRVFARLQGNFAQEL